MAVAGIGTQLFVHLEEVARARGFTTIRLAVERGNLRARSLYERLGYTVIGEELNRWSYTDAGRKIDVEEDCWTMAKRLA